MADVTKILGTISKKISKSVVIFDLETTGVNTYKDQIVQFGGIRLEPDGKHSKLEFMCKPSIPIEIEASKVHGFTEQSLEKEKEFKHYIPKIKKFFKDADVAGFNIIHFDVTILSRQLTENGTKDFFVNKKIYDAYKVFCAQCPRKLGNATQYYTGKPIVDAHDALSDVNATIMVMAKQMKVQESDFESMAVSFKDKKTKKASDISRYITYNKENKPVLNFSKKYKGELLEQVDKGFLRWILKTEFPKELKSLVKKYL